jgi:predicted GNAT family N-acyltransferase
MSPDDLPSHASLVVQAFTAAGDPARAEQAFAVRRAVFVMEQGVPADLEYAHEAEARHYLLTLAGRPVAAARWRDTDAGIKLERCAVLPAFRNRGVGAHLLRAVLRDVTARGRPIYLHAQVRAVPFYERHGFTRVGPPFSEAGIVHYAMRFDGRPPDASCRSDA